MGRLGILIVLLAVVVAGAVVVQLRIVPEVRSFTPEEGPALKKLSRADQKKLEGLKTRFLAERTKLLEMRGRNAPEAETAEQQKKTEAAARAVSDLGGVEVLKLLAKTNPPGISSRGAGTSPRPRAPGAKQTSMNSASAGSSCSGEEGGSCSGDGGACSVDLGEKGAAKPEGKETKPAAAAKPAAVRPVSTAKPAAPGKP